MALEFFAGCVGGAAGILVGHPLDSVKVRIQTDCPVNPKYRGTYHCLSTIVKQESIAGLYKGITSPLYGVGAMNALFFGVYGLLTPLVKNKGNDALWAHFAAGATAGALQSVIASPTELAKIRMQLMESAASTTSKTKGPSTWTVIRNTYLQEGLRRGVFKGWFVTLAREIPGLGTYIATYEALTASYGPNISTPHMLFAGGMAGVASWIACFPMDVIKTRYQSDVTGKYTSATDCLRKTIANEGYKALFRGLNSTIIRAFPTNAATFTAVTWVQRLAHRYQEQEPFKDLEQIFNFPATREIESKISGLFQQRIPSYDLIGGNMLSGSSFMCAGNNFFKFEHLRNHQESSSNAGEIQFDFASSPDVSSFSRSNRTMAGAGVEEAKPVGPDSIILEGSGCDGSSEEEGGEEELLGKQEGCWTEDLTTLPVFPTLSSSTPVLAAQQQSFKREMSLESVTTSVVAPICSEEEQVAVVVGSNSSSINLSEGILNSHAQTTLPLAPLKLVTLAQILDLPLTVLQQSLEGKPLTLFNILLEWLIRTGNTFSLCKCLDALDQCVCLHSNR